jgi:hypothetical protein
MGRGNWQPPEAYKDAPFVYCANYENLQSLIKTIRKLLPKTWNHCEHWQTLEYSFEGVYVVAESNQIMCFLADNEGTMAVCLAPRTLIGRVELAWGNIERMRKKFFDRLSDIYETTVRNGPWMQARYGVILETREVKIPKSLLSDLDSFLLRSERADYLEELIYVESVGFTSGYEIDLKVVNADPPYLDAILFHQFQEVQVLEAGDQLSGEHKFVHGKREFIVKVIPLEGK